MSPTSYQTAPPRGENVNLAAMTHLGQRSARRRFHVTTDRHRRPDNLDRSERPRPSEEPISTRQQTADREREDKGPVAAFQGVHRHHERDRADPVDGDRDTRCRNDRIRDQLWLAGGYGRMSSYGNA